MFDNQDDASRELLELDHVSIPRRKEKGAISQDFIKENITAWDNSEKVDNKDYQLIDFTKIKDNNMIKDSKSTLKMLYSKMEKTNLISGPYDQAYLVSEQDQKKVSEENSDRLIMKSPIKRWPDNQSIDNGVPKLTSGYGSKKKIKTYLSSTNNLNSDYYKRMNDTLTKKFHTIVDNNFTQYYNTKYNMMYSSRTKKLAPLTSQNASLSKDVDEPATMLTGVPSKTLYMAPKSKFKTCSQAQPTHNSDGNLERAVKDLDSNSIWPLSSEDHIKELKKASKKLNSERQHDVYDDLRKLPKNFNWTNPIKKNSPGLISQQNRMNLLNNILDTKQLKDSSNKPYLNAMLTTRPTITIEKRELDSTPYKKVKSKPDSKNIIHPYAVWPQKNMNSTSNDVFKEGAIQEESKEHTTQPSIYQNYANKKKFERKKEADKTVINIDELPIDMYLPRNIRRSSKRMIENDEIREYNSMAVTYNKYSNQKDYSNRSTPAPKDISLKDSQYNQFHKTKQNKLGTTSHDSSMNRRNTNKEIYIENIADFKQSLEDQAKSKKQKRYAIISEEDKKKLYHKLNSIKNESFSNKRGKENPRQFNIDLPKISTNIKTNKDKHEYVKNISEMIKRDWLQSIIDNDKHIYKMPLINTKDKENFKKYIKKKLVDLTMSQSRQFHKDTNSIVNKVS